MGPGRIDRRGAGVVVLVTAFLLAVVMPPVIHPGMNGVSTRAPFPAPPSVGACIRNVTEVVDCGEQHDAEVAFAWPAGNDPSERLADGSRPDACLTKVADYVGAATVPPAPKGWKWYPSWMAFDSTLVGAPSVDGIGSLRWHACLVTATRADRFIGSVRGAGGPGQGRPAPFGICSDRDSYESNVVSCAQPHTVELVGYMPVTEQLVAAYPAEVYPDGVPPDPVGALAACEQMVKAMTGATDPTYGGRLIIGAEDLWPNWVQTTLGQGRTADLGLPQCFVQAAPDTRLVGTIAGWGDRPLPLQ